MTTGPDPSTILRHEAFACSACDATVFKFERPKPGAGYFKFPPTIGAPGRAHILFVGLNPRRSSTNLALHDRVMDGLRAFDDLAHDRDRGRPYLKSEPYYGDILEMASVAFPGRPFADVAAVSEFYLCATEKTTHMKKTSPCAPRFLHRAIRTVEPSIIVPIGKVVADHFRSIARVTHREPFIVDVLGHRAQVVPSPHRAARSNVYPPGENYKSQLTTAKGHIVRLVGLLGLT